MLEIAIRVSSRQQADASALLFKEGSFDAVIAMHMLYHLPDQAKESRKHIAAWPEAFWR